MNKTKTILKEICIVILLILIVALLLAIILYDYIPNNKIVPVKIEAYELPEDIANELDNAILNEQNIVRTYYIDSTDLDLYEATNDYDKGKANPFADYSETTTTNSTGNSNTTTNSNTTNSNATNSNATNSGVADNNQNDDQKYTNKNEVYMTTPGKNY